MGSIPGSSAGGRESGCCRLAAASLPLVVDLSDLDYMSSRGLRVLKIAKDAAGAEAPITLAAPNDRMRQIIEISRYDMLFKVVADVASAV